MALSFSTHECYIKDIQVSDGKSYSEWWGQWATMRMLLLCTKRVRSPFVMQVETIARLPGWGK